jgi:hypothetical protein
MALDCGQGTMTKATGSMRAAYFRVFRYFFCKHANRPPIPELPSPYGDSCNVIHEETSVMSRLRPFPSPQPTTRLGAEIGQENVLLQRKEIESPVTMSF